MPLIAVRANSEGGVFEANEERNSSTLIIKWAPFIWARWGAPSICPSSLAEGETNLHANTSFNSLQRAGLYKLVEYEKLAAIIPPPRTHLVRWSGVFRSNSPIRSKIVLRPEIFLPII